MTARTALVTGSTGGIGFAIAKALAREGMGIMLHGFGEPEAIAVKCRELEALGVPVACSSADLTEPAEIEELVAATRRELGGPDVLVNCAGIQHTAPLEAFAPERWDAIIAVNLSAAFHASRLALPGMRERGWGRIINIASTHGLVASIHKAAYVAAKHGIVGLTKVTALETAGSGITANAICPGWTRTELIEPQIAAKAKAHGVSHEEGGAILVREKQPSGQFVQPDDIGQLAVFLCSAAANQITGASLPIDGAWTCQ